MTSDASGGGGDLDPDGGSRTQIRPAPARGVRPPGSGRAAWCVWTLAGSLLLAAGLGLHAALLRRQLDEVMTGFQDATATVAQLSSELEVTRRDADLLVDTLGVLRSADLRRVELHGEAPGGEGSGRAFLSRTRGLVLQVTNLPVLDAGRTYQVWVLSGTVPVSVGTFHVNAFGMSTLARSLPAGLAVLSTVTVTTEPSGGSPAPTAAPILVGFVAAD